MQRTIMVYELIRDSTGHKITVYGNKDKHGNPTSRIEKFLKDGFRIADSYQALFVMEDEIFAKHATMVKRLDKTKEN